MAPTRILAPNISVGVGSQPTRLVYALLSLASHGVFQVTNLHGALARRDDGFDPHQTKSVVFAVLIPVLVLLSGLFAGLTLGYMSLDQTQLNVLSISGTPYVVLTPTASQLTRVFAVNNASTRSRSCPSERMVISCSLPSFWPTWSSTSLSQSSQTLSWVAGPKVWRSARCLL